MKKLRSIDELERVLKVSGFKDCFALAELAYHAGMENQWKRCAEGDIDYLVERMARKVGISVAKQ